MFFPLVNSEQVAYKMQRVEEHMCFDKLSIYETRKDKPRTKDFFVC